MIFECNGEYVIVKQFIKGKLYKVMLPKTISYNDLFKWYDVDNDTFIKCAR